ncbi:hypothetical protein [Nocardia vinacea]|uniref:hypothetical protein n=1 Tax=Nocardia vinacea TaxID=96468 RepID=UPI000319F720|nr:hypothetical protein [Nocardia vinacea]
MFILLMDELERSCERGEIASDTDVFHSVLHFIADLYPLLTGLPERPSMRDLILENYVAATLLDMPVSTTSSGYPSYSAVGLW